MKKILLTITSAILFSVFAVPAFAADEAKDEAAPKAEKKAKKGKKGAKKAGGEKKADEPKAE